MVLWLTLFRFIGGKYLNISGGRLSVNIELVIGYELS